MDAEPRLTLAYFKSHPLEVTKQLETWSADDVAAVMATFSAQDMASVLDHFPLAQAAAVLELLPQDTTVEIITLLPTASAIGILRQLEPSVQHNLLTMLDRRVGPSLRLSMTYPEGTAGSLADPRVVILPPDIPVSAALERIKRDPTHATYYHYVVERTGILVGLVTTKELLAASPDRLTATIMNEQIATVAAEATEDELLQAPHWRLYHTLPVVDTCDPVGSTLTTAPSVSSAERPPRRRPDRCIGLGAPRLDGAGSGQAVDAASIDIDWRSSRSTLEWGYTRSPSRSTASASA
jgi:Mg/Co/Ni transporter MgtE